MENTHSNINVQALNNLEKEINKFIFNQRPNVFISIKVLFQELARVFFNQYILVFALSYIFSLLLLRILEPITNLLRNQSKLDYLIVEPIIFIISIIILTTILGSLSFLIISSIYIVLKNQIKTIKPKNINELIDNDRIIRLALNISKKYRVSTIKIQEERLRQKIVMVESHQTKVIILLPLIVVCFLFLLEYITGISIDSFIVNFPRKVKGTFFIASIATLLTTIIKSDYISLLTYKKQALSALKQAQILLIEENN